MLRAKGGLEGILAFEAAAPRMKEVAEEKYREQLRSPEVTSSLPLARFLARA